MEPIGVGTVIATAEFGLKWLTQARTAKAIKKNSPAIIAHEVALLKALATAQDEIEQQRKGLLVSQSRSDGRIEPHFDPIIMEKLELDQKSIALEKQINLSKCRMIALEDIQISEDSTTEETISNDWGVRWSDYAGGVSDAEMQLLWGKILAGEIKEPGRCSFKTLEIVRSLSPRNADTFLKFCACAVVGDPARAMVLLINDEKFLEEFGIEFIDLQNLLELGLIADKELIYKCEFSKYILLTIEPEFGLVLKSKDQSQKTINLQSRSLTGPGTDLYRIIKPEPNFDYFTELAKRISEKHDLEVLLAKREYDLQESKDRYREYFPS